VAALSLASSSLRRSGIASIWRSQSGQALTKDLPEAILVQTEVFANRKNQPDGNAFTRQDRTKELKTSAFELKNYSPPLCDHVPTHVEAGG
jgi:hypothetical protein